MPRMIEKSHKTWECTLCGFITTRRPFDDNCPACSLNTIYRQEKYNENI